MVVHTCKPSTWVDEAKDQNFHVSFGYRKRLSQKPISTKTTPTPKLLGHV